MVSLYDSIATERTVFIDKSNHSDQKLQFRKVSSFGSNFGGCKVEKEYLPLDEMHVHQ